MTLRDLILLLDHQVERDTPEHLLTDEQYDARQERIEFALNCPAGIQGEPQ
jgi:hypothetical protein